MSGAVAAVVSALQHQMIDDGVITGAKLFETGLKLVRGKISKKAEPSKVDTKDRELPGTKLATAAKDASVATEHHDHVSCEVGRNGFGGSELTGKRDIRLCRQPWPQGTPAIKYTTVIAASQNDQFERLSLHDGNVREFW